MATDGRPRTRGLMSNAMTEFKATAGAHMRRDLEAGSKWACECEACVHFRSLVGMEKVLEVRPLVREIDQIGAQMEGLPPGPERRRLMEQYLGLHDRLAAVVAE
jgi:hypothetical protein